MADINEIQFLLNFDFQGAGEKEAADAITKLVALLGDFSDINNVVAASSDNTSRKIQELTEFVKKQAGAIDQLKASNEAARPALVQAYQQGEQMLSQIKSLINEQKTLVKTEEELIGVRNGAVKKIKELSASLQDLEIKGLKETKQYKDKVKSLNLYKDKLVEAKKAVVEFSEEQEESNGIITKTKEAIASLTAQLDKFNSVEELSSKQAQALKSEISQLNSVLKILQGETSGQLELEKALADTRNANAKALNEILAIEARDIDIKAELIVAESNYKDAVAERVSVMKTGYTLAELQELKLLEAKEVAAEKERQIGLQSIEEQERLDLMAVQSATERYNKEVDAAYLAYEKELEAKKISLQKQEEASAKAATKAEQDYNKIWLADEKERQIGLQSIEEQERLDLIAVQSATERYNKEVDAAYLAYEKELEAKKISLQKQEEASAKAAIKAEQDYNKVWLAAEKSSGKVWMAWSQSYKNIQQKAEETSKVQQEAGNKSIWTLDNIIKKIDFMGLRLVATLFWWTIIIGSATALWEWWIKVDDATQAATDRLKDYFESFKSFRKSQLEDAPKLEAKNEFDKQKIDDLFKELQTNKDVEKRFAAYKELQSSFSMIFDQMSKGQFIQKEHGSLMKQNIETAEKYAKTLNNLSDAESKSLKSKELVKSNLAEQAELIKKIAGDIKSDIGNSGIAPYYAFSESGFEYQMAGSPLNGKKIKDVSFQQFGELVKNTSDEDLVDALIKTGKYKKIDNDPNWKDKFLTSDVGANMNYLNALRQQQISNSLNDQDYSESVSKLRHDKIELEGNFKDPKAPKGPKDKTQRDELAEMKSAHEAQLAANRLFFEESKQTQQDKVDLHDKDLSEIESYYSKVKDYASSHTATLKNAGLDEKKILSEASKLHDNERSTHLKEMQEDASAFKKYNDDRLKHTKEVNDKMLEIAKANQKAFDEENERRVERGIVRKGQKRELDQAKSFNPFRAFFGGGAPGSSEAEKFKADQEDQADQIKILTAQSDKAYQDLQNKKDALAKAQEAKTKADFQVEQDRKVPSLNQTHEQKVQFAENEKIQTDATTKVDSASSDYKSALKASKDISDNLEDARGKKQKDALTQKQKEEITVAQVTYQAVDKIANAAFEAQQKRIETQMNNLKAMYALDNTLAGNNSAAKIRLAIAEHNQIGQLQRQQAKSQKAQAMFNAAVQGEAAIISSMVGLSWPFNLIASAVTAATVLYQEAKLSSQPLPSYKKGRSGGKAEIARINEEGFEIVEKPDGGKYILNEGKEGIVPLGKGDVVHTHEKSLNLLNGNTGFLQDLLKGTGAYVKHEKNERDLKVNIIAASITKGEVQSAMEKAIEKMPKPTPIQIPAKRNVEARYNRVMDRNGVR